MGLAALAPATAPAATFVKYTDRAAFTAAAGTVKKETFNSITSDVDLSGGHDMGDFTMTNMRPNGPLGMSKIDAVPFDAGYTGLNGSTYVLSSVYSLGTTYSSFLVIEFDEAVTAFGANFTSGSGSQVFLTVDGETLNGGAEEPGGFYGFVSDTPFTRLVLRAREGSGFTYTFDDMTYSTTAVPEPASWAMMIGGFAMVGGAMRKRADKRSGQRAAFA